MPAPVPMSFTAPRFTEEEWFQETALLSEHEMNEVEFEKHGKSAILRETEQKRLASLELMEQTLQHRRETTENEDYFRALAVAPQVVRTESNHLFFLRCEKYDVNKAVIRLMKYWEMRCKVFGERAFLPLVLTGRGALTMDDITFLRHGGVQLLPADVMGRQIVYYHRAGTCSNAENRLCVLRSFFYIFSQACQDSFAQHHGYVLIIDTKNYSSVSHDRKLMRLLIEMARDIVPIQLRFTHTIFPDFKCVAKLSFPHVLYIMGPSMRRYGVSHVGCGKEIIKDLTACGMADKALPPALGGSFTLGDIQADLERQRAMQEKSAMDEN